MIKLVVGELGDNFHPQPPFLLVPSRTTLTKHVSACRAGHKFIFLDLGALGGARQAAVLLSEGGGRPAT